MKILITEPLDQTVVRRFQNQYPGIIFQIETDFSRKKLQAQAELIKDCNALIIRS